jgi:hypothetical protein
MTNLPELFDMLDHEIKIDDIVAFTPPYSSNMHYGKVVSRSATMVEIEYRPPHDQTRECASHCRLRVLEVLVLHPEHQQAIAMKRLGA